MDALVRVSAALLAMAALAVQGVPENIGIDREHLLVTEAVPSPVTTVSEPVRDSPIPVRLMYVETVDGLYAPIGLRTPPGTGRYPLVLFAHMNGGMGMRWIREWTHYGSGTLEAFLAAGYAVAWIRYRAEVDRGYTKGGPLTEGRREGRQLFNRGPLEYNDIVSIIEYVRTLPNVDPDRIGYVGLSHAGEALMMLASEYHGLRAAVASEPASVEFLARKPRPRAEASGPETLPRTSAERQEQDALEMRSRVDMALATKRISSIRTPVLIQGRDRDHNQALFRLNYELLREAGKDVEWKSYDHDDHGFIYVRRTAGGTYESDPIQRRAIADMLDYFNRKMTPDAGR